MAGDAWFDAVLMGASAPPEARVLEELERVLDHTQPSKVDRTRSWACDGTFCIAHVDEALGVDIEISVSPDLDEQGTGSTRHRACISSVVFNQEVSAEAVGPNWVAEVGRAVERLLRGNYRVRRYRWRGRVLRTEPLPSGAAPGDRTTGLRYNMLRRFTHQETVDIDYGTSASTLAQSRGF